MEVLLQCERIDGVWRAYWMNDGMQFPYSFPLSTRHITFLNLLGYDSYVVCPRKLCEFASSY